MSKRLFEVTEDNFCDLFDKPVHIHKLVDTKAAGQLVKNQPSDFIVTYRGSTFYAEVKHCEDGVSFAFKTLIRKSQHAHAAGVLQAGGKYWVSVFSVFLNTWFHIPYSDVKLWIKAGKASVSWDFLLSTIGSYKGLPQ